ncbi:hypothetical protein [Flammeovirga sp. OC4]|uniref:hypothetical protein n=1 Tax=Flammeovirga sp. OC4 TaxID=1382345 RepID=UPI0005C79561|nr:hypothetical protein [Flammeovirga sp. OC4]
MTLKNKYGLGFTIVFAQNGTTHFAEVVGMHYSDETFESIDYQVLVIDEAGAEETIPEEDILMGSDLSEEEKDSLVTRLIQLETNVPDAVVA